MFNERDHLARLPIGGNAPSAPGANLTAGYEAQWAADNVFSDMVNREEAYSRLVATINERLGEAGRPITSPIGGEDWLTEEERAVDPVWGVIPANSQPAQEMVEQRFWDRLDEMRAERPELLEGLPQNRANFLEEMERDLRGRVEKFEELQARATGWGVAAGITGQMGAAMEDPPNAASLLVGAPVRAGLLAKMAIEAGLNAGQEALAQPQVQGYRGRLGLESGPAQALENIALAGAGGATFVLGERIVGTALKSGWRAVEKALGRRMTPEERAALEAEIRAREVEAANPVERPGAQDRAEHVEALDAARADAERGEPYAGSVPQHGGIGTGTYDYQLDGRTIAVDLPDRVHADLLDHALALETGDGDAAARRDILFRRLQGYVGDDPGAGQPFRTVDDVDLLAQDYLEQVRELAQGRDRINPGSILDADRAADFTRALVLEKLGGGQPVRVEVDGRPVVVDPPALRRAVEPAQESAGVALRPIRQDIAFLPSGARVDVEYALVEAATLKTSHDDMFRANVDYPQALQPRERDRSAAELQVQEMARALEPRLLIEDPKVTGGAPIIAPDGVVESGNGRTMAIRRAYAEGSERASAYRAELAARGFDVEGMTAPVLVRVRRQPMTEGERLDFVRQANKRDTLGMSSAEQAMSDARLLDENVLALYRGGDVRLAANRAFVRAVLDRVVGRQDAASLIGADGELAQAGARRIEAAMLARAYDAGDLVTALIEDADNNIRAIGGAMLDVAGPWAAMRGQVASGAIHPDMDVTAHLVEAVRLVRRARNAGRNVAEYVFQRDAFSDDLSDQTAALLHLMFSDPAFSRPVGRAKLAARLQDFVAAALQTQPGRDMFGQEPDTLAMLRRRGGDDGPDQAANAGGPGADGRSDGSSAGPDESGAAGGLRAGEPSGRRPPSGRGLADGNGRGDGAGSARAQLQAEIQRLEPELDGLSATDPETGAVISARALLEEAERRVQAASEITSCVFGAAPRAAGGAA